MSNRTTGLIISKMCIPMSEAEVTLHQESPSIIFFHYNIVFHLFVLKSFEFITIFWFIVEYQKSLSGNLKSNLKVSPFISPSTWWQFHFTPTTKPQEGSNKYSFQSALYTVEIICCSKGNLCIASCEVNLLNIHNLDRIHAKSGRYLRYISAIFFGFSAKV